MTTLEILLERGRKEGKAEGKMEGKIEGKLEGKLEGMQRATNFTELKKDIDAVLKCISNFPDLPMETIIVISGQSKQFIQKLQKGFQKGNKKQALKVIHEIFKPFGQLEAIEIAKIDELLATYLPKFRKPSNPISS